MGVSLRLVPGRRNFPAGGGVETRWCLDRLGAGPKTFSTTGHALEPAGFGVNGGPGVRRGLSGISCAAERVN